MVFEFKKKLAVMAGVVIQIIVTRAGALNNGESLVQICLHIQN